MPNKQNRLQNSTSPYLLQHADNPVDWYPWGEEALEKARKEDKPILVSIGYSSCHWCHVMAHESFEDTSVARIMNEYFVNIKVDREERPDVDQVYMEAVQSMGLNGGWPLNVFLTPDQKPFYGGTYFPKDNWTQLLNSINEAFEKNRDKINESAAQFAKALSENITEKYNLSDSYEIDESIVAAGYQKLSLKFDRTWGGIDKAPKFPMPSTWLFLNNYYALTRQADIKEHLLFTLDKINAGGIYDHIGGGFARYAVDGEWHVPHFEKMLYDNGQLLSLYAHGYKLSQNPRYREIIDETIAWLKREMLDESGGFCAALDADSEGEEGKFYVWDQEEINLIAGDHADIISYYYDVRTAGNWEETNVLRVLHSREDVSERFKIPVSQLEGIIEKFKISALERRSQRVRPGLDNKIISGWNALVLTGLLEAYQATGDPAVLALARENYNFLTEKMIIDKRLMHVYLLPTQGFADDYSAMIQALIKYYETTFDAKALELATQLTDQMIEDFFDEDQSLFFYTGDKAEQLIARKSEFFDNVIPSSNSMMAENLFKLGTHMDNDSYRDLAAKMVRLAGKFIKEETEYMSNWASIAVMMSKPIPEIAIVGENAFELASEFNKRAIPNKVIMASPEESDLPLLEYKTAIGGETTIYVCFNKTCKLPVQTVDEALKQIP